MNELSCYKTLLKWGARAEFEKKVQTCTEEGILAALEEESKCCFRLQLFSQQRIRSNKC